MCHAMTYTYHAYRTRGLLIFPFVTARARTVRRHLVRRASHAPLHLLNAGAPKPCSPLGLTEVIQQPPVFQVGLQV